MSTKAMTALLWKAHTGGGESRTAATECEGGAGSGCRVGEIFRECESSNCGELKCWQLEGWEEYTEHPCDLDCVSKCFCRPGLYRNRKGRCVKPWRCPQYKYRAVFNWTNFL
ncbi:hypothetical protein HPB51_002063 [Rhipicephalus microplus]|uniref:TIL domain-containing protein n=1 Tax=Rhipicephalus microplus TaxID=6941 RepID=A0A9J6E5Q8_RHIMP|nr:hypothetical protein HPB51_002063 [Rhipicephalus microplus]